MKIGQMQKLIPCQCFAYTVLLSVICSILQRIDAGPPSISKVFKKIILQQILFSIKTYVLLCGSFEVIGTKITL